METTGAGPGAAWALLPPLAAALEALGIGALNETQARTIPAVLRPRSRVLCASETGAGKTLACLLPVMQKLKLEEAAGSRRQGGSPRAVVLVPSAELAHQTGRVAKLLSHHAKLRTGLLTKAMAVAGPSACFRRLFGSPLDLLVATPHQVATAVAAGRFDLDSLRHLVVDEADAMLADDTFFGEIQRLLARPTSLGERLEAQLDTVVLAAATVSAAAKARMARLFPGLATLASPLVHVPLGTNTYRFYPVDGPGDAKQRKCLEVLARHRHQKTLVFCNSSAAASILHAYLDGALQRPPGLIHGWIPEAQRIAVLERFRAGDIQDLVCTDLMARGIDTLGSVQHVLLYDLPQSVLEFIHRSGRAGRAGTRGAVSALVTDRDRLSADRLKLCLGQTHAAG